MLVNDRFFPSILVIWQLLAEQSVSHVGWIGSSLTELGEVDMWKITPWEDVKMRTKQTNN